MEDARTNQTWIIVLLLIALYFLITGKEILNGSRKEARIEAFAEKLVPFMISVGDQFIMPFFVTVLTNVAGITDRPSRPQHMFACLLFVYIGLILVLALLVFAAFAVVYIKLLYQLMQSVL